MVLQMYKKMGKLKRPKSAPIATGAGANERRKKNPEIAGTTSASAKEYLAARLICRLENISPTGVI